MRILLLAPIVALLGSSTSPPVSPIRIGATGSFLTDDDVAQIEETGGRYRQQGMGDRGRSGSADPRHVVRQRLPRAGSIERRRPAWTPREVQGAARGPAAYKQSKIWTRVSAGESAQVAVPGRKPDEVLGSGDLSRPFVVSGTMTDDTLKSLVAFIRTSPKVTAPPVDLYENALSARAGRGVVADRLDHGEERRRAGVAGRSSPGKIRPVRRPALKRYVVDCGGDFEVGRELRATDEGVSDSSATPGARRYPEMS